MKIQKKSLMTSLFVALGFISSSLVAHSASAGLHWPPEQDLVVYTASPVPVAATVISPDKGVSVKGVSEVSLLVDGRIVVTHTDNSTETLVVALATSNSLLDSVAKLENAVVDETTDVVMCLAKPLPSLSNLSVKGRLVLTTEPCARTHARPKTAIGYATATDLHTKLVDLGMNTADMTLPPSLSAQPQ